MIFGHPYFVAFFLVFMVLYTLFLISPWGRRMIRRMNARNIVLPALKDPKTRDEIKRIIEEAERKEKIGK